MMHLSLLIYVSILIVHIFVLYKRGSAFSFIMTTLPSSSSPSPSPSMMSPSFSLSSSHFQYLDRESGKYQIAYEYVQGGKKKQDNNKSSEDGGDVNDICVVFLPGFRSSMQGSKAKALREWCQNEQQKHDGKQQPKSISFLRFDYHAHGQSTGEWADGTISRWLDDCLAILDHIHGSYYNKVENTGDDGDDVYDDGNGIDDSDNNVDNDDKRSKNIATVTTTRNTTRKKTKSANYILVGSSMGGWLALLTTLRQQERQQDHPWNVVGLVLIAPAVDMTKYYPKKSHGIINMIADDEDENSNTYYEVPNAYDDQQPYRIYQRFLDDGRDHYLLHENEKEEESNIDNGQQEQQQRRRFLKLPPIRIIHGMQDEDVPYQRSLELIQSSLLSSSSSGTDENSSDNNNDVELTLVQNGNHRLSTFKDLDLITTSLSKLIKNLVPLE